MNDNEVILPIIQSLRTGLDKYGMNEVKIKQGYQPRQSGVEPGAAVYLHKIISARFGYPGYKDLFDVDTGSFIHTEFFYRAATYQVNGLSVGDHSSINQFTSSDIVETTADALQSQETIWFLARSGIRMERITQIRELYFIDDSDRHEQNSNFDFTVTYKVKRTDTVLPVDNYTTNIYRIN